MRRLLLLMTALAPMLALACYNDRDTLGYELHNKPDIQKALTGRFDRYPPLYYTMRVDRLRAKKLLAVDEYDDLAVALGRLGRSNEALVVLAKKAKLPNLSTDAQYRLFANRGTIEVLRWFQDGAKASEIHKLEVAKQDVSEAIKINPNAHFGREGAQLGVISWLISVKTADQQHSTEKATLADCLYLGLKDPSDDASKMAIALAGLITLGGAWESPDIALAMGDLVDRVEADSGSNGSVAWFAVERYNELVKLGHKPLDLAMANQNAREIKHAVHPSFEYPELATAIRFKTLRKESDEWHDAKTRYMMERLRAGRHPDTDPSFWDDWKEPAMPVLPTDLPKKAYVQYAPIIAIAILVGLSVLLLLVVDRLRKSFH